MSSSTSIPTWDFEQATIGYHGRPLINGFTARLRLGDLVMVTGPNGCGKTCLMRTLAGEVSLLGGTVRPPAGITIADLGVVAQRQEMTLPLPTTLAEMIRLGTVGLRVRDLPQRIETACAIVGLAVHQLSQTWAHSSGGECQRALLARALVREPRVLLLDEASNQLDHEASERFYAWALERCRAGQQLVVAAVHDEELVQRFATHRLAISAGEAELVQSSSRPPAEAAQRS